MKQRLSRTTADARRGSIRTLVGRHMKQALLATCSLCCVAAAQAQVTSFSENFESNSLSQWTLSTAGTFVIGNSGPLAGTYDVRGTTSGTFQSMYKQIGTNANLSAGTSTWEFVYKDTKGDPSGVVVGQNGWRFYLATTAVPNTNGNGYAIRHGNSGSTDNIYLVKMVGATETVLINSNVDPETQDYSIKVTRSATGLWTLYMDAGTGGATTSVGTATDVTYFNSGTSTIYTQIHATNTTGSGQPQRFHWDNINFTAPAATVAAIGLSSPNPAVAAGNVSQGTASHVLYQFQTDVTTANTTLNTAAFTTTGSYTASDIANFRLWYNTTNNFSTATQVGNTITTGLGAGSHTFSSIAQQINAGNTGYFWITTDVNAAAVIGNTITVSAITTADLTFASGNKSGTAFNGGTQTIVSQPGATTINPGVNAAPATISSLTNTQGAATSNFEFQLVEDGPLPATDNLDMKISQIVIGQGSGNTITDWTQALAGAELTDGTNSITGIINTTDITFPAIPNNTGDLGFIADNATKNYVLKVWLKTVLGGTLPMTIDGKFFVFRIQTSGITTLSSNSSQIALSQDENSGSSNNQVDVTATRLSYAQQPGTTGLNAAMIPSVRIMAIDVNSNRDLSYTNPVTITSTGTLSGTSTTVMAAVSGQATFNNLVHSATGTGLTLSADDGTFPTAVSNPFSIIVQSNATDHFRSVASGQWSALATWESSPDSLSWYPATLVPNQNAADIVITRGDTVSIGTTGVTFDGTTVQSGGVLSLSTSSYTINNGTGEDLSIENGGMLLLNNETGPSGTGTIRVRTGGTIAVLAIGSGGTLTTNYLSAAATRVFYEDSSIFDYRVTTTNLSATGITYFNTGATDLPILRLTNLGFNTIGGSSATTINGRVEANTNFSFTGNGVKTIRGGIFGTATVGQTGGALTFTAANAIIGGTVTLDLTSMVLQNGATIPAGANVTISQGTITKTAGNFVVNGILNMGTATMTNGTDGVTINGTIRTANPNGFSDAANSTFIAGAGTITLSPGSVVDYMAAQTISARTDYADLTISGTGTKTLAGPVTVNGAITLSNGLLALGANDLTAVGAINNAGAAAYIKTDGTGRLKRNVATGTTTTFPVGNGSYNPASLTGNGITNTVFSVGVVDNVMDGGTSGPTITVSPTILRTWNISGTGNVDMTLQWNAADENANAPSFNYSKAYIAHYNTDSGRWENYLASSALAGPANGSGPYTVSQAGISSFSPFTVASTGTIPLAVNLETISAVNKGALNTISWKTGVETGSDVFMVERSKDGVAFQEIGQVKATGKSGSAYHYDDRQPLTGVNYYRLKIVATNGTVQYSKVVNANAQDHNDFRMTTYPNPVTDQVSVTISGAIEGVASVAIADQSGRVLISGNVQDAAATLNIGQLPAGMYLLQYTDQAHRIVKKITKY